MRRGLALLAGVIVVIGAGIVGGITTLSGEPNEIRVTLKPAEITAAAGDTFTVDLTIENVSLNAVNVNGIGIDKSLLDGVSVEQMDPGYREVKGRNYPLYGNWNEYTLDRTIFGGEKLTVVITFRAGQVGQVSGDVTVWIQNKIAGLTVSRARRATLNVRIQ
jgi:hypothetical protein